MAEAEVTPKALSLDDAMRHDPPGLAWFDNFAKPKNEVGRYGFAYFHSGTRETFELPIPPQEITVDEPAATTITPTLGAGKWVERRGNIFKQISIAGTFGFAPAGSFDSVANTFVAEKTAFGQFHSLRKFFRDYQEIFRKGGADHEKSYMVWINPRDSEQFVVEPLSFRLTRQKAFVYRYQIELRVLGVFTDSVFTRNGTEQYSGEVAASKTLTKTLADIQAEAADTRTTIDLASNGKLQPDVKSFTDKVGAYFAKFDDVIRTATSTTSGAVGSVTAQVFGMVGYVNNSLTGLVNLANTFTGTVSGVLEAATYGVKAIRWGLDLAILAKDQASDIKKQWHAIPEQYGDAIAALTNGGPLPATTAQLEDPTFASMSTPSTLDSVSGYREERPLPGETGEQFAARVAGSTRAWPLIVALNGLRPPYFSSEGEILPGTIPPGGTVLVPVFSGSAGQGALSSPTIVPVYEQTVYVAAYSGTTSTVTVQGTPGWREGRWDGYTLTDPTGESRAVASSGDRTLTVSYPFTTPPAVGSALRLRSINSSAVRGTTLSPAARALGKDAALIPTGDGLFDLSVNRAGDLATLEGTDNLLQALQIKLRCRYGDLPLHTSGVYSFGVDLRIGETATPDRLFALETSIRSMLLGDPRVASVRRVAATIAKDVVRVSVDITPKGANLFPTLTQTLN